MWKGLGESVRIAICGFCGSGGTGEEGLLPLLLNVKTEPRLLPDKSLVPPSKSAEVPDARLLRR